MAAVGRLKVERLTRRADFLRVAGARRKYVAPGLVLQACAQTLLDGEVSVVARVGFTATRKIGGSVVRNRARRRLREAARAVLVNPEMAGFDYVVIARAGSLTRAYDALVGDLRQAVDALSRRKSAA
jgi:ribonuclease P protein component